MAIIEVNLEKPALVEEHQYPGQETVKSGQTAAKSGPTTQKSSSKSDSSGGGKAKLLGLLGVLAGVGVLVWKLKNRGGTEQTHSGDEKYEHGPEPEIGGDETGSDEGGAKGKVAGLLGLVVGVVGLVVAVQKRRN